MNIVVSFNETILLSFNLDEESDPIDTGDEEIALYLTGAGDNGTSDVGPQCNDICGRVSSATTSTDLDRLADTSLSRLLTSSAARTSSSTVNIREDKSNQTQSDSQSFSDYVLGLKRQSGFYKQFKVRIAQILLF